MKQVIQAIFIFFIPSLCLSQNIFFEKSLEPDFDSGLNTVIHDSTGNIYAVGGGSFGFTRAGWFMKIDNNGAIQFQVPLIERDDNYLFDVIKSADHNFLICGYNAYCDLLPSNQGILYKMSPTGNIIWSHVINPDTSWNFFDNRLRQVFELQNGKFLLRADSTLYFANSTGDTIWSRSFAGGLASIGEDLSQRIIAVNQSQILILDTLGQQVNQFTFPYSINQFRRLPDSTFLILCGSNLMKLDSVFNIISQFDILPINFSASLLAIDSQKILISNQTGSDFAAFDLNLQLTDSFRTQPLQVIANSISVSDTMVVVAGAELNERNYHYLKSYSTTGNNKYRPVDLELSSMSFETAYGFHYSWHPPEVNSIGFVAECTVTNTGSDTIHSFNINAHSMIVYGPCGPFEYIKHVSNINLAPGQSMSVALDTLIELGVVYSPPFTYTFCAWISSPDSVVDKDHSNDYVCDSFVVNEIVSIEAIDEKSAISIYPNPSSSSFTISRQAESPALLEIFNGLGEKVYSALLRQNKETINAKLNPGVYFIIINDGEKRFTVKQIVE